MDEMSVPQISPRPRMVALIIGIIATLLPLFAVHAVFPRFFADHATTALAILLAGIVSGTVTSLAARTYYSGNPALAFALAVLGYQLLRSWLFTTSQKLTGIEPFISIFAVMTGHILCICSCWTTDVFINFPRAYPCRKNRPPAKHINLDTYFKSILPTTGGLVVITAMALTLFCSLSPYITPTYASLCYMGVLILGCYSVMFLVELPGSLWTGFAPLLGLTLLFLVLMQPVLSQLFLDGWGNGYRQYIASLWLPAIAICTAQLVRTCIAMKRMKNYEVATQDTGVKPAATNIW